MKLLSAVVDMLMANRANDRRNATRAPVLMSPISLQHAGKTTEAACHDISSSGMRLTVAEPIRVYDTVIAVYKQNYALRGKVVWLSGDECGIEFEEAALFPTGDAADNNQSFDRLYALPDQRSAFLDGEDVSVIFPDRQMAARVQWCKANMASLLFAV